MTTKARTAEDLSVGHYENFPVASVIVPRRLREAIVAIYHFARTADDLADEGELSPAERLAGLDNLRRGLDRIAAGALPDDEPLHRLALTIRTHALPMPPFHALLDAFEQDVGTHRYATFDDLLGYCRRSADPIGRLLLALYGNSSPADALLSDRVCTALQLVNFWQDVAGDWQRGRVYLPLENLRRFQVDEDDIGSARTGPRWRALMAFEVDRARRMLRAGLPLAASLRGRIGLELRLVVAGGLRICDRIDAVDGDVFRRRPALAWRDWIPVVAGALLRPTSRSDVADTGHR